MTYNKSKNRLTKAERKQIKNIRRSRKNRHIEVGLQHHV